MNTTKYTLIPRGPVRGIDKTIVTEKTEIELNDFEALKVLLQGHTLTTGEEPDVTVVKISDFVEGVDPQVINEPVNLVPDVTAGCKTVNASYCKVFGSPRCYEPGSIEVGKVKAAKEVEQPVDTASYYVPPVEPPVDDTVTE